MTTCTGTNTQATEAERAARTYAGTGAPVPTRRKDMRCPVCGAHRYMTNKGTMPKHNA